MFVSVQGHMAEEPQCIYSVYCQQALGCFPGGAIKPRATMHGLLYVFGEHGSVMCSLTCDAAEGCLTGFQVSPKLIFKVPFHLVGSKT